MIARINQLKLPSGIPQQPWKRKYKKPCIFKISLLPIRSEDSLWMQDIKKTKNLFIHDVKNGCKPYI